MRHNIFNINKPETDQEKWLKNNYKTNKRDQILMALTLLLTTASSSYFAGDILKNISDGNAPLAVADLLVLLCNGYITYREVTEIIKSGRKAKHNIDQYSLLSYQKAKEQNNTNAQPEA